MSLVKSLSVVALSGTIVLGLSNPARSSNLIVNGDFEAVDIGGLYTTYNSATVPDEFGWSISDDFVYLVNSYWNGASGSSNLDGFDQSLELRPQVNFFQSFATEIGRDYELSFLYAHDPDNQQGWGLGNFDVSGTETLLSETLFHNLPATRANLNFLQYTGQFTADSETTTLSFSGDPLNGAHGFVIDGVSVSEIPQDDVKSVPEPSIAFGLLSSIALGFHSLKQKRSR